MSMLADPKQRKRYHLVPRGKPLYEDKNRFGTKMLEKMGWTMGKGLGAQEDGSKDFIRIRYKNDELGLGFEHRDDQWTQHEQSFNGLLKTLNNDDDPGDSQTKQENGDKSEDEMPTLGFGFTQNPINEKKNLKVEKLKEKISGISLEERSKQSKARVHYKKFTKGKDLAQYSEKDLANIFGKKAVDEQQAATNDFYKQLNNALEKNQEETKRSDNECLESKDLINTGVSVNDYFKAKMEAIKKRKYGYPNQEHISDENTNSNEMQQEEKATKKEKKKKKKKNDEVVEEKSDTQNQKDDYGQMTHSSVSVNDYFKMKMEAFKNKKNAINNVECNKENTNTSDNVEQDQEVPKKKKKMKHDKEQDNYTSINGEPNDTKKSEEEFPVEEEPKLKKKKDKTKKKSQQEAEQQTEQNISSNENEITKKIIHEDSTAPEENNALNSAQEIIKIDLTGEPRKKKKKKNKTKENEIIEIYESDNEESHNTVVHDPNNSEEKNPTKTMKKSKEFEENCKKDDNFSNSNETKIVSNPPKKSEKSKKKNKKEKNSAT
ncbi:uncharacterized protein ACRADG_011267 isoform 2-T2 [Cochliomyia hominivorax]